MSDWEYLAVDFERNDRLNDLQTRQRYYFITFMDVTHLDLPADRKIHEMTSVLERFS